MNAFVPHIFEDNLVRSIMRDGEPWFAGKDICQVLGIKDHKQALERLDEDERGRYTVPPPSAQNGVGGGEQIMIIVSVPGAFQIIFTSRVPVAKRLKRWLAHEVLPALMKTGTYTMPERAEPLYTAAGEPFAFDLKAMPVARTRCELVSLYLRLRGREAALSLWREAGLPLAPELEIGGQDEARECLAAILNAHSFGQPLWALVKLAMDTGEGIDRLFSQGIWVQTKPDRFVIANRHAVLERIMEGTRWADFNWCYTLKRLPGAMRTAGKRFEAHQATRGVSLPANVLDLFAETMAS